MSTGEARLVLAPAEGKTLPFLGGHLRFLHHAADSSYSFMEAVAPPGVPGPPLHRHQRTDESVYVLEGALGFQLGNDTVEGLPGAHVFIPRGTAHTFWNHGPTPARYLSVISPPGVAAYLEELAEGLAAAGDSQEEGDRLRQRLAARYDVEILGPPRQAGG